MKPLVATLVEMVSCEEFCRRRCMGLGFIPVYRGSIQYLPAKVQAALRVVEAGVVGLPVPLVVSRILHLAAKLMEYVLERGGDEELARIVAANICEKLEDMRACLDAIKPQLESILALLGRAEEAMQSGDRVQAERLTREAYKELASLVQSLSTLPVNVVVGEVDLDDAPQP